MPNLQESTDDLEFARQGISKLFFLYDSQNCTIIKGVWEYCGYWCVHTHLLLILAAKRAQKSNMNYSEPKHVIHCACCYGFLLLLHRGRQLCRRLSMPATFAFKPLKECGCMWPRPSPNMVRVIGSQILNASWVHSNLYLWSDHSGRMLIPHLNRAIQSTETVVLRKPQ